MVLIIPPLLKRIRPRIITYIKRGKIRNVKCCTHIILTRKIQLISIVINSGYNLKGTISSGL
uniref:Uncharacterized protein LOC107261271 n=1 Tax=Rhizophora mucronata TaxID=61149 RepID=A0A2P2MKN5_RHIMU